MNQETLKSIDKKLDVVIRLLTLCVLENASLEGKKQHDKIIVLVNIGLDNNLIADILGTTQATVRAAVSKAKKKVTVGS